MPFQKVQHILTRQNNYSQVPNLEHQITILQNVPNGVVYSILNIMVQLHLSCIELEDQQVAPPT